MNKTEKHIAQAAECYAKRWQDHGCEKGEIQAFWTEQLMSRISTLTQTQS